jgi:hypothetical protein
MDPRKVRRMDTMRTLLSRADSFELRNNIVNPFHFAVFSAFARLRPNSRFLSAMDFFGSMVIIGCHHWPPTIQHIPLVEVQAASILGPNTPKIETAEVIQCPGLLFDTMGVGRVHRSNHFGHTFTVKL